MKIQKTLCILLVVFGLLVSSACQEQEKQDKQVFAAQQLTRDALLADYDEMWQNMYESYPFWGVLERSQPDNPDYYKDVIDKYRQQLQNSSQTGDLLMLEFLEIVASSLYEVCGTVGHVSIINADFYRDDLSLYKSYAAEMPELQPWLEVLDKPEVAEFYNYYDFLMELWLKQAGLADVESDDTNVDTENADDMPQNLSMQRIGIDNKTAYICVNSFADNYIESDIPQIQAFMQTAADCDNLIIDIRENGGGNTVYWEQAFVGPNIESPLQSRLIRLMCDTDLTRKFYGSDYAASELTPEQVQNFADMTSIQQEDLADLTLAREILVQIEPETASEHFNGQIWLLVGPQVYSSAESFAVFCKQTGFATLVGQPTGGSNSGGGIFFELPNTHLLVQFDVEYCLNSDGSCNMETGTEPDIVADDALAAVLALIEENSKVY